MANISDFVRYLETQERPEFLPRQLDVMGLIRRLAITNPMTAARELPGKLAESRQMLENYEPGQQVSPELMNQFMNLVGGFAPMGITAYHGTPTGLIKKFSSEKVGSGAGTTNFGYGTYFAEHPTIAGVYRKGRVPSKENPEGFLYKVDIPDESLPKMLNWYEEVPESIRKPLSEKAMEDFGSGLSPSTGEKLYKEVVFGFKVKGSKTPEKDASNWLSEQGIPGIKYENMQMVQGQGRGTNNYVIFKPEDVKIESINDIPIQQYIEQGLL